MVKLRLSLWKFMLGEILMRSEIDLFAVYSVVDTAVRLQAT